MVAVFSGFMFGQDPLAKMMRLGLATAIAINATSSVWSWSPPQ